MNIQASSRRVYCTIFGEDHTACPLSWYCRCLVADWPQGLLQVKEAEKRVETEEEKRLARRHGAPLFLVQLLLTAGLGAAVAGFVLKCVLSAISLPSNIVFMALCDSNRSRTCGGRLTPSPAPVHLPMPCSLSTLQL